MTSRASVGSMGESVAAELMIRNGWEVLARNYHIRPLGEIDLVARDEKGTLVLVEVKTMLQADNPSMVSPEDNVTKAKLKKMIRVAEVFANKFSNEVREGAGWRIDLVAILLPRNFGDLSLTELIKCSVINHYENVV
jgi:putative endonuclease